MQKFNHFITEQDLIENTAQDLMEKLITFGGKAYPKFGNIVVMAGGAGSGKGFILSNLVGIEGKTFDVDELKKLASKTPAIQKRVKDELGVDIFKLSQDLKDPKNVEKLHEIIGIYLKTDKSKEKLFYRSVLTAPADRKPNIIFDMTFKELSKLEKVANDASKLGYDKKNIHIVWVVNDIEVAKAQNLKRARVVPSEILVNTHRGAANTMGDIINMGNKLKKYMDGDIVFAFNKVGVDANLAKSDKDGKKIGMKGNTKGGSYIKDANYFYVKRQGKPPTGVDKLDKEIRAKIKSYIPKEIDWS
jgi:hypothetical protein